MTTHHPDDQQDPRATASSEAFFNELKEWSARKLQLLETYLKSAANILRSVGTVYYVDGFAGRGSYGNDQASKGSPLRAAEL